MLTILFVEDDPDIRALYGASLEAAGFYVVEAATVADAVERLRCVRVDAAILDYELPDGNGFDLTRSLFEDGRAIPAVAFTAHREQSARLAATRAGCASFVVKPCAPAVLVAALHAVLGVTSGADEQTA